MQMAQLLGELKQLGEGEHKAIYVAADGAKVTVKHTAKITPKDFAVGLIVGDESEFNPTHIRLLFDLYIKRASNPEGAHKLFLAFEKLNTGDDPSVLADDVADLKFPMQLDNADVNLYYTQLLFAEQDINYTAEFNKQSKMDPPHGYLMRFIRWVASGDSQIDRIIFAAAGRRYPAPEKYDNPIK